jgi:Carboxypeptidase regulatory-like domain
VYDIQKNFCNLRISLSLGLFNQMFFKYFYIFLLIFYSISSFSQGVTGAKITGRVTNLENVGISGIGVSIIHEPTQNIYKTKTRNNGRYDISNLFIGGPYTILYQGENYVDDKVNDIYLSLNQTFNKDVILLEKFDVIADIIIKETKVSIINSDMTGSASFITNNQIQLLPSISRSLRDYTRLVPASYQYSFIGRNRHFNNFSVDGSIFNNPFGLDNATPGGQANAQPINLDAIEQIQVSLSPFDVRQGNFTGAGVNIVTKSGTNELQGSIYRYGRNENLIGSKVGKTEVTNPNLKHQQLGINFGGPIIKNKLFFFFSGESERKTYPGSNYLAARAGLLGDNVSRVLATDLDQVKRIMNNTYSYQTGEYENYNHYTENDKLTAKINWNINNNNSFILRYIYLKSWRDVLPHPAISASYNRGPDYNVIPFENTSYIINNNLNSFMGELNTRISNKFSNRLLIGYTSFRDFRDSKSSAFSSIDILDGNQANYISLGLERFSTKNYLDQDVFQFTNNISAYFNDHIISAGISSEVFLFENSFNLFYYPGFEFSSMEDFISRTDITNPNYIDFNSVVENANTLPYSIIQMRLAINSIYIQDEWYFNSKLKLSGGIRLDMPVYLINLESNKTVSDLTNLVDENGNPTKVDVGALPGINPNISPRLGFNYNMDKNSQFRGGSGLFSGRIPFVWLANQAHNRNIDPENTFEINATSLDYHFPQVWKTTLAFDHVFKNELFTSIEAIFSKDIYATIHYNYNSGIPTTRAIGADNRLIYANGENSINATLPSDNDPNNQSYIDAGIIVMDNTNKGHQFVITSKIAKEIFANCHAELSYTFLNSKNISDNPGEISADIYQRNPIVGNTNNPEIGYSNTGYKHRIISNIIYTKTWNNQFTTHFGIYSEIAQGMRYSYVYAGDMNLDGISGNDLIYIPNNESEILFANGDPDGDQWEALNSFIDQDPYMSRHRGEYAKRNGVNMPWFTHIDLRLLQDFNYNAFGKKNTIQFTFDILNLPNLISPGLGIEKTLRNKNPISFVEYQNGIPAFEFDEFLSKSFKNDVEIYSRWRIQIGIRYIFK